MDVQYARKHTLCRLVKGRGSGRQILGLFRHVQILEIIFNNFHRSTIDFEIATMIVTLPISLFALIKIDELNLAQKLFFTLAVLDTPFVILCNFGIISELYNTASAFLSYIRSHAGIQKDKYLKRYVRSWPILKVKFGSANFVDKMTPVKSLDVSLNVTASLLLMT